MAARDLDGLTPIMVAVRDGEDDAEVRNLFSLSPTLSLSLSLTHTHTTHALSFSLSLPSPSKPEPRQQIVDIVAVLIDEGSDIEAKVPPHPHALLGM